MWEEVGVQASWAGHVGRFVCKIGREGKGGGKFMGVDCVCVCLLGLFLFVFRLYGYGYGL